MRCALSNESLAHLRELGRARERRMRRAVLVDRSVRQAGAVLPDLGEHVEVGAQRRTGALQARLQELRGRNAEHAAVDADRVAGLHMARQPLDMVGRVAGRDLHEFDTGTRKLALGLDPVAAVGEQRGMVARDDQCAHRPAEPRQPLPPLPTLGQVLRQMRVGCRHHDGSETVALQRVLNLFDAKAESRSAGIHGVGPDEWARLCRGLILGARCGGQLSLQSQ